MVGYWKEIEKKNIKTCMKIYFSEITEKMNVISMRRNISWNNAFVFSTSYFPSFPQRRWTLFLTYVLECFDVFLDVAITLKGSKKKI